MEIRQYGDPGNPRIILIHGFESPWQIWEDYICHFQERYCIIVPILPGHNADRKEDFQTFALCAGELEDYVLNRFSREIYAVYGMSMGGVLASQLWINGKLEIGKLVLESSPLTSYGKLMTWVLTKQYLNLTHKAQQGNQRVIRQAVGTMVTEDMLEHFVALLNSISDTTIRNYIREVGAFKLPENINSPGTEIFYFHGSKPGEILFQGVAKYIKKHYPQAKTFRLAGKGHCEDALIYPQQMILRLEQEVFGWK